MDGDLEPDSPIPNEMPEKVTLVRFQIRPAADEPDVRFQLKGDGHTWTMTELNHFERDLLLWLHQNGFVPIGGTCPPQFQRKQTGEKAQGSQRLSRAALKGLS